MGRLPLVRQPLGTMIAMHVASAICCPFSGLALAFAIPVAAHAQVKQGVENAVQEPLRDTRIEEKKIPPVLASAASAPYSLVGMTSCAAIASEIGDLTAALGPDVDLPGKAKGEGVAIASAAAGEVVKSLIPGLGVVRVVTGADKQQRRAQAAVYAGSVRRGFLKGIGFSRHCTLPAAPEGEALRAVPDAFQVIADTPSRE